MSGEKEESEAAVEIATNLATVRARIQAAAGGVGRSADDVVLIAVGKAHGADLMREALNAGHRIFGENRVNEAESKWPALQAEFPGIALHLIGPLQTNKVRRAVALFDVIHTVDRVKLARALADEMARAGRMLPCFIQVNTGEEPQKSGVTPGGVDALISQCIGTLGLNVIGLMCLPPLDEEPSLHYSLLADIAGRNGLSGLSIGMTGDYEIAVQFGATHVRVGTAIFGERSAPAVSAA